MEKEIKKNFSKYQKKYEEEDVQRKRAFEEAKKVERRRMREEYDRIVRERRQELEEDRKEFGFELPKDSGAHYETITKTVEVVLEESRDVIKREWS